MSIDRTPPAPALFDELRRGSRRALSVALSLVESTNADDRARAAELLALASRHPGPTTRRMCLTGAPGVGKSTLMERLGLESIARGHRVAVLAIDPSSRRTGGSILGDKMRMPLLAVHDDAFVRPSPSRTALGGTAESTRDAITVCEAAGFDTIIVETVGVGQSEVDAATMVDAFWLLVLPTAGDDVQGIKRGIMEVADGIVITKADIDATASLQAMSRYRSALQLLQPPTPDWLPPVVSVSALSASGMSDLLDMLDRFFAEERRPFIEQHRAEQRLIGFDHLLRKHLSELTFSSPVLAERVAELRDRVYAHDLPPTTAINQLFSDLIVTVSSRSPL